MHRERRVGVGEEYYILVKVNESFCGNILRYRPVDLAVAL